MQTLRKSLQFDSVPTNTGAHDDNSPPGQSGEFRIGDFDELDDLELGDLDGRHFTLDLPKLDAQHHAQHHAHHHAPEPKVVHQRPPEEQFFWPPTVDERPVVEGPDSSAGVAAFAGFGKSPDGLKGSPAYALRALARRRSLRRGLEVARVRKRSEVAIYEDALRAADAGAVVRGLTLLGMLVFAGLTIVAAGIAGWLQ